MYYYLERIKFIITLLLLVLLLMIIKAFINEVFIKSSDALKQSQGRQTCHLQ